MRPRASREPAPSFPLRRREKPRQLRPSAGRKDRQGLTARKTGKNTGRFQKGPDPRRGGGRKGRSGRKTLAFAEACAALADAVVLVKVTRYLGKKGADPSDPAWRWCAEYATNYGKGKPPQQVTVTGEDGGPVRFTLALGEAHISDE